MTIILWPTVLLLPIRVINSERIRITECANIFEVNKKFPNFSLSGLTEMSFIGHWVNCRGKKSKEKQTG